MNVVERLPSNHLICRVVIINIEFDIPCFTGEQIPMEIQITREDSDSDCSDNPPPESTGGRYVLPSIPKNDSCIMEDGDALGFPKNETCLTLMEVDFPMIDDDSPITFSSTQDRKSPYCNVITEAGEVVDHPYANRIQQKPKRIGKVTILSPSSSQTSLASKDHHLVPPTRQLHFKPQPTIPEQSPGSLEDDEEIEKEDSKKNRVAQLNEVESNEQLATDEEHAREASPTREELEELTAMSERNASDEDIQCRQNKIRPSSRTSMSRSSPPVHVQSRVTTPALETADSRSLNSDEVDADGKSIKSVEEQRREVESQIEGNEVDVKDDKDPSENNERTQLLSSKENLRGSTSTLPGAEQETPSHKDQQKKGDSVRLTLEETRDSPLEDIEKNNSTSNGPVSIIVGMSEEEEENSPKLAVTSDAGMPKNESSVLLLTEAEKKRRRYVSAGNK